MSILDCSRYCRKGGLLACCEDSDADKTDEPRQEKSLVPHADAKGYLRILLTEEPILSNWIRAFHLGLSRACVPSQQTVGVDLCCGPTVHQAAVMSRFLTDVYLADPDRANRVALRAWIKRRTDCPDQEPFLKLVAAAEGLSADQSGASIVEHRLKSAIRGILRCNLGSLIRSGRRPHRVISVKADVLFLLTRVLEDLGPGGSDPRTHAAPLSRLRGALRHGGLLALAGVTCQGGSFKSAMEDALITAGYGNLRWSTVEFEPRRACPSTHSFLLLANVIWPDSDPQCRDDSLRTDCA